MFLNYDTKELSCKVQIQAATIRKCLYPVFENAIVNTATELKFLENLTNGVPAAFAKIPFITCRVSKIHGKPIVKGPDNKPLCELGDLLVVVKYHLPSGVIETKSIIYQVKLSRGESTNYDISAKQCLLLSQWPQFSFGRGTNGKPHVFNLSPKTLEFGSYLLEPRNGFRRIGRWGGYGITPTAIRVYETTNCKSVAIKPSSLPYTLKDVERFFSHIAFLSGEHHHDPEIERLISALYRHVKLAPDPPDEFKGYSETSDDDGFAVIELNIRHQD